MNYQQKRMQHILDDRPIPEKKKYRLKPISDKRAAKIAEQKELRGDDETEKQKWFNEVRKKLVSTCGCGCGEKSSKHEDDHFRSSICHIFPQRLFPSVALHLSNYVERSFWNGCHFKMDNKSMDLWPNMADFDDIKEVFHLLSPILTDQERAKKFYTHLEKLVYQNT